MQRDCPTMEVRSSLPVVHHSDDLSLSIFELDCGGERRGGVFMFPLGVSGVVWVEGQERDPLGSLRIVQVKEVELNFAQRISKL